MNLEAVEQQVRHPYVLVVFPYNENLDGLLKAVAETGRVPLICHSFQEAQEVMKHEHIQVIICEDRLPDVALKDILKLANHRKRTIPVIITSRTGEWEEFLRALRQGAFDYLALPPRFEEVHRVLELASAESRRAIGGDTESVESQQFHASEFVLGLGESKFEYMASANSQTWGTLGSRRSKNVLLR
jgi:DNA-binding NtrC family response regulator